MVQTRTRKWCVGGVVVVMVVCVGGAVCVGGVVLVVVLCVGCTCVVCSSFQFPIPK